MSNDTTFLEICNQVFLGENAVLDVQIRNLKNILEELEKILGYIEKLEMHQDGNIEPAQVNRIKSELRDLDIQVQDDIAQNGSRLDQLLQKAEKREPRSAVPDKKR